MVALEKSQEKRVEGLRSQRLSGMHTAWSVVCTAIKIGRVLSC